MEILESFYDLFGGMEDFAVVECFRCSADVSSAEELFGLRDVVWDIGL